MLHPSTSPEGGRLMSSDSQLSNPPTWDWPSWMKGSMPNPLDVFAAPRNLVQPILRGWVFGSVTNVTEQNSSAPDCRWAELRSSVGPRHGRSCRSHCRLAEGETGCKGFRRICQDSSRDR